MATRVKKKYSIGTKMIYRPKKKNNMDRAEQIVKIIENSFYVRYIDESGASHYIEFEFGRLHHIEFKDGYQDVAYTKELEPIA